MTFRPTRIVGDPVLHTPCLPINEIMPGVKAPVKDLVENADMDGRADFAVNQTGISLCVFSWSAEDEISYILNPVIIELSDDESQDGEEGCLLVPGLWSPTECSLYACVEGTNLDGQKKAVEDEGLVGRYIQHEADYPDGHLYIDRLDWGTRKKAIRTIRDL